MFAVFFNVAAVILGTFLGKFFGSRLTEATKTLVMTIAGLFTLVIGLKMALDGTKVLRILLALLIGGLLGHHLRLEDKITRLGEWLKRRFTHSQEDGGRFAEGFLTASVLFCVGAMAIIGSFKAGVSGDNEIILVKSVMDGFLAIVLTGSLGIGVGFSALSVLVYQGGLTLLAGLAKPFVDANPLFLTEIPGLGGLLVMTIGINLLGIKKIRTADLMPGLLLIVLFVLPETLIPGFKLDF